MKRNKKIALLLITLILLISIPTQVFALTFQWDKPQILDSTSDVGRYNSLAVVNGYPAISYYDYLNTSLQFIRAKDASGTNWNYPQTLDSAGAPGSHTSLAIVNGYPAISYYDFYYGTLKFIRANDADGSSWGTPQILDSTATVGLYTSLVVVNGKPAISYYDLTNTSLKFIIAKDANGSDWEAPQTLDSSGTVGQYNSMAVVNGKPAISYHYYSGTSGTLRYIRAKDVDGTEWNSPQTVATGLVVGEFTSLAVVNGNPAISYFNYSYRDLVYIRARDADGTNWDAPLTLDSSGSVGMHTSLAVVYGVPAISYYDESNGNLKFIRARDANGSDWDSPITLDSSDDVGWHTSLAVVNGNPAISYYDHSNSALKYITIQGVKDLALLESGSPISNGSTLDFGSTTLNTPITKTLNLQNNGTIPLELNSLSLPDGFSLTGGYETSIPVGDSLDIQINLIAHSTGSYSGNLTIKNQDVENSPYTITLTGEVTASHGEIAVMDGSTDIADGSGSVNFGTTTVGTPVSRTFTVGNSSPHDLNLYSLTLPSGFSLQNSFAHTLPTNAVTSITVQLDSQFVGTYSGNFSLSNDDADENPFNFTISGEVLDTSGEIAVLDGLIGIADGTTSPVDFGSTTIGNPISRTFTIQNLSSNDLDIYSLTLPYGFSLQGSYNHVVAPSGTTAITVQLDSQFVGTYSGEFSLSSDDTDEDPFNFAIEGQVNNTSLETGIIAPLNGSTVLDSRLQAAFNHDVLHDGSDEAADNPINYLLVEDGRNGLFDTTTCLLGVAGDDVQQTITSVTYDDSTYIATINTDPLPSGRYQLLVCGTASIQDATGNVLNGGAYDSSTTFTVVSAAGSGASSASGTSVALLPATGFMPGKQTYLPTQPADLAYNEMDALTLQIPALKVDVPIVGVPQTSNGWDVTWLTNAQAGWLNGTAYPTWDGNTVLTGHVTNASGNPGPFAGIKSLKYGDRITIQAYGETYTYEVRENKLVTRDNMSVIEEHKDHDWVTLITCEYYNETTDEYLFRRVVRAVLVEVK